MVFRQVGRTWTNVSMHLSQDLLIFRSGFVFVVALLEDIFCARDGVESE